MSNSNYLDTLNPSQRAAVEYCDGPQLVIAGAGSGKTRVLTCKIAYLLQNGYTPDSIIALTFTKKAATEMQQRIDQLVGGKSAHRIWMGTFHSLFCRILRREAQRIGFRSDFTIYDQTDSTNLISTIIKEMGLKTDIYKASSIHCQISNAKNYLITPKMYLANKELMSYDSAAGRPQIGEIYQRYWTRCSQANAMDFDDLLLYTNILFRDHKDVLEYYQDYFKYVLVDEYQDTNHAQHAIIVKLSEKNRHLTVVGDDAQSIYSFRGADIKNILNLQNQIQGTKLFKLEQNYRSTQTIVEAANSLIDKNKEQIRKTIFSENERGFKIKLTRFSDGQKEAFHIIQQIIKLHNSENQNYKDCAILYRANSLCTEFERVLNSFGIKYRIFGGQSFFDSKEVKDMMAMLRIMVNTNDEEAFKRILKVCPFGIGESTIRKISEVIQNQSISFFEILGDIDQYLSVNKGIKAKLETFYKTVKDCIVYSKLNSVYETMRYLIEKFNYNADFADLSETDRDLKLEKENQFLYIVKDEETKYNMTSDNKFTITDFLSSISLSETEPENDNSDSDYVSLMTIHQAKGLEFKNVFVVGVENEIFPSQKSLYSAKDIEEERRLFYVAITRAERNCYISYAEERFRFGKKEPCHPSIFLKDIDSKYIQKDDSFSYSTNYATNGGGSFDTFDYPHSKANASRESFYRQNYTKNNNSTNSYSAEIAPRNVSPLDLNNPHKVACRDKDLESVSVISHNGFTLQVGTKIMHERFGKGCILELSGTNADARIVVNFSSEGKKTLLLKFAKFTVIE